MKKFLLLALISISFISNITLIAILINSRISMKETEYVISLNQEEYNLNIPTLTYQGKTYISFEDTLKKYGLKTNESDGKIHISFDDYNTYVSRDGILESGRKYSYFGTDSNSFDLQSYIDTYKFLGRKEYPEKQMAKTPKQAAEIAQVYLGIEYIPNEKLSIDVHYDIKEDTWIAITKFAPGVSRTDGSSILTIQRSNGKVVKYSNWNY